MKKFFVKSLKDWKVWGLMFMLQFPSLRPLYKYIHGNFTWVIPTYLVISFFTYSFFLNCCQFTKTSWFRVFLSKKIIFVFLILITVMVNFYVYPLADSLKLQGKGSDQDDALIVTAKNLLNGKNPYEAKTYFPSNPLSPGPGWVILNLPFALKGLYFLLTPFYVILLLLLLKKITGSYFSGNMFLILCMSSLAFWETMVVGSDMFAIGVLFVLSVCAVFYNFNKGGWLLFLSVLLLAFGATSRIIFICILPVIGILLWRRPAFKHLIYLLAALLIAVLLHLVFYLWNPAIYTPLHLLAKGGRLLTSGLKFYAAILTLAVLVLTYLKVKNNLVSWLFFFFLSLGVPLFFVSIGDLINMRNFNFALWEGANYLVVVMPIYLAYFALQQKTNE